MDVCTYLFFPGSCAEALEFYAEVFGGEVEMISTYGESPRADDMPEEMLDLVMYARLRIGSLRLMASDVPIGRVKPPQGFAVSVSLPDIERAKRIFQRLAKKGDVMIPFAPTFWAKGHGMCCDRFGTPWMISAVA